MAIYTIHTIPKLFFFFVRKELIEGRSSNMMDLIRAACFFVGHAGNELLMSAYSNQSGGVGCVAFRIMWVQVYIKKKNRTCSKNKQMLSYIKNEAHANFFLTHDLQGC